MTDPTQLHITRLGAQGDGVAETPAGPVYVPFALPGETVAAEVTGERGRLITVETPSPDRIAPLCQHFGACGGCALQHLAGPAYQAYKRALVAQALAARGIATSPPPGGEGSGVGGKQAGQSTTVIRDLIAVGPGERRRAALSARRTGSGVVLGFHEEKGDAIVDLAECPVLATEIVAALPGIRALLAPLMPRDGEARVLATLTATGLDIVVEGLPAKLSAGTRAALAAAAAQLRLVRLALGRDIVYATGKPTVHFPPAEVVLPEGAFLQAAPSAETAMAGLIASAVGKARRVADLYCGCGTFTFALARKATVLAVDSSADSIAALADAARRAQGIKKIETKIRDLAHEPLSRKELEGFDAVVLDPPRAGARAQSEMLAKSKVPAVVAVSCNPATLARDLRILLDAGYRLEAVTPVDQFLFTPHVEVVAVLRR